MIKQDIYFNAFSSFNINQIRILHEKTTILGHFENIIPTLIIPPEISQELNKSHGSLVNFHLSNSGYLAKIKKTF